MSSNNQSPNLQIDVSVNQSDVDVELVNANKSLPRSQDSESLLKQVKEPEEPINLDADVQQLLSIFLNKQELKTATNAYQVVLTVVQAVDQFASQQPTKKTSASKLKLAMKVVEHFAKGADGVSGTSDDLISADLVKGVTFLLNNKLVETFIETAISVTKGIFNINKHTTDNKNLCCCQIM